MRKRIGILIFTAMSVLGTICNAQSEFEIRIALYEWPQVATADAVLQIPQLRQAVLRLFDSASSTLIIRYPGGDAGNNWGESLRAILISLGIESERILLQPGTGIEDTLLVIVNDSQTF